MLIKDSKCKKKTFFFIFIFICATFFGFYNSGINIKENKNIDVEDIIFSALNDSIEQRIDDLLNQMTIDEKCAQLYGIGIMDTADNNRLGIPGFKMADGPHGVRGFGSATSFPNALKHNSAQSAESIPPLIPITAPLRFKATTFC